jgi:hypothetical protein
MVRLILIDAAGKQVGAVELGRDVRLIDLESLKALGAIRAQLAQVVCVA